ncbi:MAG: Gfo/Idh/MocA family oxidoreductase [Rhodothermales bacterium]
MATTPLRGVGVGAGYFSQYHYDAWQRLPGVEMVALMDTDAGRAYATAARYGIPEVYTDYAAMLDATALDFVDVITPPPTHHALCLEAAQRGINVICQKPIAPTMPEAEALVSAMEQTGARFMVHENWRWQPWYRQTKALLNAGLLGDVYTLYFRMRTGDGWPDDAYMARQPYFRDYPRLLMFETGVHFIDTFRYLLGEVTSVQAAHWRRNPHIRGEDAAFVILTFESGATAVLDANRYNEAEDGVDPRYTFGTFRLDASKGHLTLSADGALRFKRLGQTTRLIDYAPAKQGFAGDSCLSLQQHFVRTVQAGTSFESSGTDYLKTLRVLEACYESAESGQLVSLSGD